MNKKILSVLRQQSALTVLHKGTYKVYHQIMHCQVIFGNLCHFTKEPEEKSGFEGMAGGGSS